MRLSCEIACASVLLILLRVLRGSDRQLRAAGQPRNALTNPPWPTSRLDSSDLSLSGFATDVFSLPAKPNLPDNCAIPCNGFVTLEERGVFPFICEGECQCELDMGSDRAHIGDPLYKIGGEGRMVIGEYLEPSFVWLGVH